jgi:phage protein U
MMMLGNFAFSIDTTAYHQLTREAGAGVNRNALANRTFFSTPESPGVLSGLKGSLTPFP